LIDTLLAEEGREGFAAAWFRANGFEEEAKYVDAFADSAAAAAQVFQQAS
jgi:hypothetical protein